MMAPRAVLMMKARRLHQRELAVRDHVPGLGIERLMQRDEIGFRQQLGRAARYSIAIRCSASGLRRGRPIDDPHAEAARTPRRRLADAAGRDQADGLAVNEAAGEMVRLRAGKAAGAHRAVALDHPPRHRDHQADMQVGDRLRHDRRHHGDDDAALGRLRDVDIVGRDRHRGDGAQFRIGAQHGASILSCSSENRMSHFFTAAISFGLAMILPESGFILTSAMLRSRSSALGAIGWLTKTRGLPLTAATVRCRRRRRRRIARRRESYGWRRAPRAPSECRARAPATPYARLSRRVRPPRRRPAAEYG